MLCDMEASFVNIRDAAPYEVSDSVRVASQAALMLINKYFSLTDESELYQLAMGKCALLSYVPELSMILTSYQLCAHIGSSNGSRTTDELLTRSKSCAGLWSSDGRNHIND